MKARNITMLFACMLVVLGSLNVVNVGAQLSKTDYISVEEVKYYPSKIEVLYLMKNPTLSSKLGSEAIKNTLKYTNIPVKGVQYYTNRTTVYEYERNVFNGYEENCHDIIIDNKTQEKIKRCFNDSTYRKENTKGVKVEWVEYDPREPIKSKDEFYFKKIIDFKPKLGNINMDYETEMLGYKSTWFNTSWNNRINVTVTNPNGMNLTGIPQLMNISHQDGMATTFCDLRFIDQSGEVLDYWYEFNETSGYVDVWVELGSENDFSIYFNNSEAKYQGNFVNTFALGDEIVSDTTSDYTTGGSGTQSFNASCGTLPNGETIGCLQHRKASGNNEFYARSDDGSIYKEGNYTFRARYKHGINIGSLRIGLTDNSYNDRQWNILDGGRDALFYHSTTSGRSDDQDEALGLGSGADGYVYEWLIVNSTTVDAPESTNYTLSLISGGDLYNNGYAYADDTTGYLYLYAYDSSVISEVDVDFWFIDDFVNGTLLTLSEVESSSIEEEPSNETNETTTTVVSNTSVNINIDIPVKPINSSCLNDNLLRKWYYSSFTGYEFTDELCDNGCYDNINEYGAGCAPLETDVFIQIIIIVLVLLFALIGIRRWGDW